jgi:hypothetical protein
LSRFLPLTIHFVNGGTMVVFLDRRRQEGAWPEARLVEDAGNGICRPAIAFAAFKKAAAEQGLLEHSEPSVALIILDQLSRIRVH